MALTPPLLLIAKLGITLATGGWRVLACAGITYTITPGMPLLRPIYLKISVLFKDVSMDNKSFWLAASLLDIGSSANWTGSRVGANFSWQLSSDFEGFEVGLQQCLHAWCRNGTFHCRCLVHFFEVDDLFFWNSLPARLKAIESRSLVCEISSIPNPNQWMDQLMPELELMLTSG